MEERSWLIAANKKAEEYFSQQSEQRRRQAEAAMAQLKKNLGLKPDQSLWEYLGLFDPGTIQEPLEKEADAIGCAIDDFFAKFERVYVDGEAWELHFPPRKDGA